MEVTRFQGVMMAIFVGNVPQKKSADMLMAVRIFDKIPLEAAELALYDGKPWEALMPLVDMVPVEIELSADEGKFVAKVMVENVNYGAKVARLVIPMWEQLYSKWEEFAE